MYIVCFLDSQTHERNAALQSRVLRATLECNKRLFAAEASKSRFHLRSSESRYGREKKDPTGTGTVGVSVAGLELHNGKCRPEIGGDLQCDAAV
ncbi:hypothetical protein EXN66_Car001816 [Channa argus]|uniref:Uncharacterized protein n=1 Tax=Channa argus TaxID=215402 RepID=A0A6G1P7P0_CHAAH|nr:hypothetical protein EXN66_Car001816 [Channa argus]